MARGTDGGVDDSVTDGVAVRELTYSAAGEELDRIIEEFEAGVIDVDRLVERLERATEIVDELDRRLRRTRLQVEELVPRLERIGRTAEPGVAEGEAPAEDVVLQEVYVEETETDMQYEYADEDEEASDEDRPPGLF
jgi:exodeoxyribonuclease VII small subunit